MFFFFIFHRVLRLFSDNVYDIPLSFQELVKHPNMKVGIKDKEKALLLKLLTAYFLFCFFCLLTCTWKESPYFQGQEIQKCNLGLVFLNPLTPKISLVILLTVCQMILIL